MANRKRLETYNISCSRMDHLIELRVFSRVRPSYAFDPDNVDTICYVNKSKALKVLTQEARRIIARRECENIRKSLAEKQRSRRRFR